MSSTATAAASYSTTAIDMMGCRIRVSCCCSKAHHHYHSSSSSRMAVGFVLFCLTCSTNNSSMPC